MPDTPKYLPELQAQWLNQLNALRTSNDAARRNVEAWDQRVANDGSLQPQLDQARLAQMQAAQAYNSFIESGSQIVRAALDAETRLKTPNLSMLERHQLETTRDNLYSLAGEFTSFKTQNDAQLLLLSKVDIGPKTYYPDGRVEWNDTAGGMLGQAIDGIKGFASGVKDALLQGPFTSEENYAICQSALSALVNDKAGKILSAPVGGHADVFWSEGVGKALDAADPAAQMCRMVYPKGQSPRELYLLGEVIEGIDPLGGEFVAVLVNPERLAEIALLDAFDDPQVQALWSSEQAAEVTQSLTGNDWVPFVDGFDAQVQVSALDPLAANPQWGVLPDIGQVPTPGDPIAVVADGGNGTMTDAGPVNGYGDGSSGGGPITADPPTTPPPPALSSLLNAAQLAALDLGWGMQGTGLVASNLSVHRLPDGSYFVANEEGDIVGTLSAGADETQVFRGLDGRELTTDADGRLWEQEITVVGEAGAGAGFDPGQAAAALTFLGGIVGLQNWSELNDGQRVGMVASLYSQLDSLGGGGLPGSNLGGAAGTFNGMLALISGIENDNALQAISGGLQVANGVSQLAGGGDVIPVPYLQVVNLIIALDNIDENPLGAVTAALAMMGPWGQVAAAVLTVVSMFLDDDIPPSIGEAEVRIDASTGEVVVDTTRDERGGGGTAAQWAEHLARGALSAGIAAPQAGAAARHLPSVGYYHDPDGMVQVGHAGGNLYLRWTDENGVQHQRTYDGAGMRWDAHSVEGQSDIVRDYMQLLVDLEPKWPPLMYQEVHGGILRLEYGVATMLYATALGTYDGQEAHMHGGGVDEDGGGQVEVEVGAAILLGLRTNTIANSTGRQEERVLTADEIQSVPNAGMGANPNGPTPPRGREPIVFVPAQAVVGGGSRDVTAGMVRSLGEAGVVSDQQLAATAMIRASISGFRDVFLTFE